MTKGDWVDAILVAAVIAAGIAGLIVVAMAW